MRWKILDSDEQLNLLIQSSDTETFAIFKHSTRCSISAMSKNRLERNLEQLPENFQVFYLDLLTHRPISNAIARILEVEHQSPQILLVSKRQCVYHASHSEISVDGLLNQLRWSQN